MEISNFIIFKNKSGIVKAELSPPHVPSLFIRIQIPLVVTCRPTKKLLGWLRRMPVARLTFHLESATSSSEANYTYSELCHRADICTLLSSIDFQNNSAASLIDLGSIHPRPGILSLAPFQNLQRVALMGRHTDPCTMSVLSSLPKLRHVEASGYKTYCLKGLPSTVKNIIIQWPHMSSPNIARHLGAIQRLEIPTNLSGISLEAGNPTISLLLLGALQSCKEVFIFASQCHIALPRPPVDQQPQLGVLSEPYVCDRLHDALLNDSFSTLEITAEECLFVQPTNEYRYGSVELDGSIVTDDGIAGVAHLPAVVEYLQQHEDPSSNNYSCSCTALNSMLFLGQGGGYHAVIEKRVVSKSVLKLAPSPASPKEGEQQGGGSGL